MDLQQRYALEHLAAHLYTAREWNRLFLLIDEGKHRVQQAVDFESFNQPSVDLEQYALPAAIEVNDWERFSSYTLMAANLRGLAEELADEAILRALARQGQSRLATGLAGQLADPLRRTWARAVLASCSEGDARAALVRNVRGELDDLSGPLTGDRLLRLQSIARHLGPELDDLWRKRLSDWVPNAKEQQEIRWMLAEAWAAQNRLLDSRCREILAGIDAKILIGRLPGLWLRYGPDDLPAIRELSEELGDPDGTLFWSISFSVLDRLASADDDSIWAERAWEEQAASAPPVSWSEVLIEQGRHLFGLFNPAAADRLATEVSDPALRAALQVVRLEQRSDPERARNAFNAVEALAEPAIKLRWALRTALAWPEEDVQEKRRLASILMKHLHGQRYSAEATDLARFLDLVAAAYPDFLRIQTDNVVWAPEMTVDSLLALVEAVTRPDVLAGLIERAEKYAAVVGKTEAEGFELRTRLLTRAACRLCSLRGVWDEDVVKKLLPEEEDELREVAAHELAALGKTNDAWKITERIRSSRRKLIAQLSIAPGRVSFNPENLYGAVASVDAAEDERLALEMLAEPPIDPEALIERYLTRMRSRERQGQALIDLAHRAQALEDLHREGQKDPMAPLQLVRGSLTAVGSDEHLLGLTLELVELAAPLQKARALAEFHEAIEVILLRLNVPWEPRREAFQTILARLKPILLEKSMRNREFMARCAAVAGLVNLIVDLPDKAEESLSRKDLREHWHEVFPVILAAAGRLNGLVAAHLVHPVRARIWGHWLPEISRLVGWERSWKVLERLEGWLPRSWCESLHTRWRGLDYERFIPPWTWLNDEQKKILRLCLGDPRKLPGRLTGSAGERGLLFRLAVADPERLPEVLRRFQEPERSRIALCLVRDNWVCPKKHASVRDALLAGIDDAALRLEAESRQEGKGWLGALAERVARHGLDPSRPDSWPLLRRLRNEAQPEAVPLLADAVLDSLPQGREREEKAFRVWLNGFLVLRNEGRGEMSARTGGVREALQKSLRLGPAPRDGETHAPDATAAQNGDDEQGRFSSIYRRWTTAQFQGQSRTVWSLREKYGAIGGVGGTFAALATAAPCNIVDLELWNPTKPHTSAFPWGLIALAVLLLANIQVGRNFLRSNVPYEISRGWRIATILAFGIPLLGFCAVLAAAQWAAACGNLPGSVSLENSHNPSRICLRTLPLARFGSVLFREWGLVFYMSANTIFYLWLLDLKYARKHWLHILVSLTLHAATAGCLALHRWHEARKPNKTKSFKALLLISVILCMVPLMTFIGSIVYLYTLRHDRQKNKRYVTRALDDARKSSLRWHRVIELRDTWLRARHSGLKNRVFRYFESGGPWQQARQVKEYRKPERFLRWLYSLKSAALIFDGAAVYVLVGQHITEKWQLAWILGINKFVACLNYTSLLLGGLGLLLILRPAFQRWFRISGNLTFLDQNLICHYLIYDPLCFLAGLQLGAALYTDNSEVLGKYVVVVSFIQAIIFLFRVFISTVRPSDSPEIGFGGFLLFAVLTVVGIVLTVDRDVWGEVLLGFFGVCTTVFPLAVPLFILSQLLSYLLRPFGPCDPLDPAWPRGLRRTLLFLLTTALLPLGGLAVPAWIWIRYRHWPSFERAWHERVSGRQGTRQILEASVQGGL